MNTDYTEVILVLDRSGSMMNIWADVVGGIQSLMSDQKKVAGKCLFSLFAFDDVFDHVIAAKPVSEVAGVPEHIKPRNMTALLDAMGLAITLTGDRLRQMPEAARPSKIIFIVQTDGFENSSRKYKKPEIAEMVRHQTDKYNWQFVFLGANMDSIAEADGIGIQCSNSVNWAQTKLGTDNLYKGLSNKISSYRSDCCSGMAFTAQEKTEIEQDSVVTPVITPTP